jgi:hypothetical protein
MKPYSTDLREKILHAYDQGFGSQRALAALFGVRHAVVEKVLQRAGRPERLPYGPMPVVVGPAVMRPHWPWSATGCKKTRMPRWKSSVSGSDSSAGSR